MMDRTVFIEWLDAHGVKSVTELSGAVEVG